MSYPGDPGLSVQAQERVMTAFKQVLANLQEGQGEEAKIGLEFVLRLDPTFVPATNLKRQLSSSSDEVDLGDIIAQLQAPTTDAINTLLIEAVETFNSRDFLTAKEKVEQVLIDLPGHQEARELRDQIDKALKIEGQVGQFLVQAREALAKGDAQEAANFVMMAQALDPHHTGIATTLKEIDETGGLALSQSEPDPAAPQPTPGQGVPAQPPVGQTPGVVASSQEAAQSASPMGGPTSPADQDAFAVEFDTNDPFAGLIEPSPDQAASASSAEAGPAPESDDVAFPPMADTSDLFTAPDDLEMPAEPVTPPGADDEQGPEAKVEGPSAEEIATEIQALIKRGQAMAEGGDHQQAISVWSKIYLIDPAHQEAGGLIDEAKEQIAATDKELEDLLRKARDARDRGELDEASGQVDEALMLRPTHLEATMLAEELASGPAAPSAPDSIQSEDAQSAAPQLPELDDDLFGEAPETVGEEEDDVDVDEYAFDDDFEDFDDQSLVDRVRSKLSPRIAIIAAVALIVVLAGIWMGSRFLSSEPEIDESAAVTAVLVEAERLSKENKVDEAIHLLREFPATGLFKQRIDMKIARYEKMLAPAEPTPVPETAVRAEEFLEQGLWWAAYTSAGEGLKKHPEDQGLIQIQTQVLEIEPEAQNLESALKYRDHRAAVSLTDELLSQYPEQGDLVVVLERSLFNAALAEARTYNLTGAEKHLERLLDMKPTDDEAVRFLQFVKKYKVRGADIQLEIFIRSLSER